MGQDPIRLNKYLSQIGFCSRREADKLIARGRVKVNGIIPELGTKVTDSDEIAVDGKPVAKRTEDFVYLAFNKPVGIVCTTDSGVEKDNIIDYINYHKRIFPVGRLDKASEGLILLTDDGTIVNAILKASKYHEKEYVVKVNKPISQTFISRMAEGVPILETITRKCKVEQIDQNSFKIILTQGLNRQIRRMCEYLGYKVVDLKRTRIMHIELDVEVGKYRELRSDEIDKLKSSI